MCEREGERERERERERGREGERERWRDGERERGREGERERERESEREGERAELLISGDQETEYKALMKPVEVAPLQGVGCRVFGCSV